MPRNIIKKGFTLLEILLVVGIISILAGIVIVAINPGRQIAMARNTERKSDLKQINSALQQYYIDNRGYPDGIGEELVDICDTGANASSTEMTDLCAEAGLVNLSVLVPTYITAIPKDPQVSTTTSAGYKIKRHSSGKIGLSASAELNQRIVVNIPPEDDEVIIVSALREGLVGYWPLDDDLADFSNNNRNGSCLGTCPATITGVVGNARSFNSQSNIVTIANSTSLPHEISDPRTLCVWVKPSILYTWTGWAFSYGVGQDSETLGIWGDLVMGSWGYWKLADVGGVGLTVNHWDYICYSYNGSQAVTYKDGDFLATSTRSWYVAPGPAYIGSQTYLTNEYWKGDVDEMAFWDRVLSGEEIEQLYNNGDGRSLVE